VCIAASRFFVQEAVADRFTRRFVEVTKSLRLGDGRDPATDVGPLANRRRIEAAERLIEDALAKGATLCAGGRRAEGFARGFFVDPSGTRYGPMSGKVKGDTLSFEMSPDMAEQMGDETGLSAALVPKFEARYDDKSGHLFLTMSAAGMEADQIELKKVDSLETSSPSPTPSETETPSPTPTVTVTETPSPTSSPSPTDTAGPDAFKDNQVRNGADVIADAIDDYTTDNTALPPTPLGPGGGSLDAYLPAGSWPENPFTETPMTEGSGWGDFDYNDNGDGSYTLLAHLSDGSDYDITRTP
jgi:hypothetical protein